MALFFRGETRKFFLILRGTARSEKNCADFEPELREFSRGRFGEGRRARSGAAVGCAGKRGNGAGMARVVGGCGGECLPAAGQGFRRGFGGVSAGFRRRNGTSSPSGCTAIRLGSRAGCPQCVRCRPIGARTHRSIAQGLESSRGVDFHTVIAPPIGRIPMLTAEIHSATSRCRAQISTPWVRVPQMRRSPSPFGRTGLRVGSVTRYPHVLRSHAARERMRRFRCGEIGNRPLQTL